ncbi:MAG: threonine synthase [Ilumatobacteraceae bacterium]
MRYVSTRGRAPELGFRDVLMAGLAVDGGLYVPHEWPSLPTASAPEARSYAVRAAEVMAPFVGGEIADAELRAMCEAAYATFRHPDVVPLVDLGDGHHLLELFHGPTLAFKDVALQLVGRMFDHVLAARGDRVTIVGATSGDTGGAAIDGVRACRRVEIVMLYPAGRVSDVQRRQMTTVDEPHVRTVAIDGTFDDCQDLVKAMFADAAFREEQRLAAVNSINWARVMAQVVYYVVALERLGHPAVMSVPTGNFGNVLAGWIARRMGARVGGLVVASNANDILTRFLATRSMDARAVTPTLSPSMDIQVSSNFERLYFEMLGRDGAATEAGLADFRRSGSLRVDDAAWAAWIEGVFAGYRCDDAATLATMRDVHERHGMLIDPHTAVGLHAAREHRRRDPRPVVTLATAHPAKFPDAVRRATGRTPELPAHLADLMSRPERVHALPNDLRAVQDFVARRAG